MKDFLELKSFISALAPIGEDQWQKFSALLGELKVPRGEHFIESGVLPKQIAFVRSGLFKRYYLDRDGNEFIKDFSAPGTLMAPYSALLQNKASHLSFQAMEDSELVVFGFADFCKLYEQDPVWDRVGRIIAERLFIERERREAQFQMLEARDRYLLFLKEYRNLLNKIPLQDVAAFLGITPVSLSRLRKDMASADDEA